MARGYSPRTVRVSAPKAAPQSDVLQQLKYLSKWIAALAVVSGGVTASVLIWPYVRYGVAPVLLGTVALTLVLWHQPRWALRHANFGAGYVLLALAL
ncbi:MAG: hypothetical protein FJ315_03285, partial [SAR202 cluster bacterium]|nr:hypothetical protein [SAR202 cluster bacterium]